MGWGTGLDFVLRLVLVLSFSVVLPRIGLAEALAEASSRTVNTGAEFQFGGAASATAAARVPEPTTPDTASSSPLLRLPSGSPFGTLRTSRKTAELGSITIFSEETEQEGRELFRFGTAVTHGRTTAGMHFTFDDDETLLAQSEVFMGFSVTGTLSVGMSGIFGTSEDTFVDRTPRLGLNAAFDAPGGALIQGEFAGSPESNPVFGLSLGLQF